MTATEAATWMGVIAAVGVAIDCAEVISTRAAYADAGIYSYRLLRTGQRFFVAGPLARVFDRLLGYPGVLWLSATQIACAALLVTLPLQSPSAQRWLGAGACAAIVILRMLFYARNVFGQDGSDQMLLVILSSALIAHLAGNSGVATIAVAYAAGQLLLAYLTSGIAKAISPVWRSGRAIIGITRTIGYGQPRLSAQLLRFAPASLALCWFVIVFECGAPFLVLGGNSGALALIAAGVCFHLGIALVMGLNIFVWSFAAAYPAVYLIADRWSAFIH